MSRSQGSDASLTTRYRRPRWPVTASWARKPARSNGFGAGFGWRLGVMGASLVTALTLTLPALSEARDVEGTLLPPRGRTVAVERATRMHIAQPGDTLSAIAFANAITADHIAALNGLIDPNLIRIGQALELPNGPLPGATPAARDVGAAVTPAAYTVQPGDTLSGIAVLHNLPLAALAAWNGLDDPDRIAAGAKLALTGSGVVDSDKMGSDSIAAWVGSPNYWPGRPNGRPIAPFCTPWEVAWTARWASSPTPSATPQPTMASALTVASISTSISRTGPGPTESWSLSTPGRVPWA